MPRQARKRRRGAPTTAVVPSTLPAATRPSPRSEITKGSKHASLCAGPFVAALARMPPAPLQGAKRAAAGLADVTLRREDEVKAKRERAARALVAILPPEAAMFILHAREPDPRPAAGVAEDLVDLLKEHGEGALNSAAGALGRLLTLVMDECPSDSTLTGVHVKRFLEKVPPSAAFGKGVTFLRDWCGVDLPARGPTMRPAAKAARAPSTRNDTEEMDLMLYIGLEVISLNHPSPFAAGHAAGWAFLARHSLRFEQSRRMCASPRSCGTRRTT